MGRLSTALAKEYSPTSRGDKPRRKRASKRVTYDATPEDLKAARKKFGRLASKVGWKRDKDGIYAHTHRARSKSYETADKIPIKMVKWIESTG